MIRKLMKNYMASTGFSFISEDEAMDARYTGLKIFDEPLIGYAAADDALFDEFMTNGEILNGRFMHPGQWLPESKTVVSVFFPFTAEVKKGNAADMNAPSNEWLHARYEGQKHLNDLTEYLRDCLIDMGYNCVAPALDSRYRNSYVDDRKSNKDFGGNWSERHAAYVAGLGTFGLSKGLITKRGVAGRFLSLITDMKAEPTPRDYKGIYEYCSMCGACAGNCPANAISLEEGKKHVPCSAFLDAVRINSRPRYGCGKCQVGVPCMDRAPNIGGIR